MGWDHNELADMFDKFTLYRPIIRSNEPQINLWHHPF